MTRIIALTLCSTLAFAQMPKAAGARDLYFGGFEAPSVKPVLQKIVPAQTPTPQRKAPVSTGGSDTSPFRPIKATGPLGLRYSILKIMGSDVQEVPVSTRFQAGDRIQIKIQSNSDGFLYIVSQGTSGSWKTVFPSKERSSNRIRAGEDYILPNNSAMRFAGNPGVEKLFVMLTRTPESDLDSVLYNLKSRPAADAASEDQSMQIASNVIGDPLVAKLRSSHTRDLVLEEFSGPVTVTEGTGTAKEGAPAAATAARKIEKAMYVVSRNQGMDARVVADIRLVHE